MLMVTIVSPIAISGDTSAIVFERSARFSSTNCIGGLLRLERASAHQQAELFAAGVSGGERRPEAARENTGDAVGDLDELLANLHSDPTAGAAASMVEPNQPNHRGGARL